MTQVNVKKNHAPAVAPVSGKIAHELRLLAQRIEGVIGTGICVELALRQQNADYDREIAACIRQNIVHRLYDSHEQVRRSYRKLTGESLASMAASDE